MFPAFNGDVTTLIGPDGLHPTAAGYQVIATTFFNVIKASLEAPAATTLTPVSTPRATRPPTVVSPTRK